MFVFRSALHWFFVGATKNNHSELPLKVAPFETRLLPRAYLSSFLLPSTHVFWVPTSSSSSRVWFSFEVAMVKS